jgi:hypothetical protein
MMRGLASLTCLMYGKQFPPSVRVIIKPYVEIAHGHFNPTRRALGFPSR